MTTYRTKRVRIYEDDLSNFPHKAASMVYSLLPKDKLWSSPEIPLDVVWLSAELSDVY